MLRLLGILSLGHLIFGGRRRRLRRGILFGALLGFLANRDFDTERAAGDVHQAARNARRAARDAVRTARQEIRKAAHDQKIAEIHERIDARKAEREERVRAIHAEIEARKAQSAAARSAEPERNTVRALPVSGTNEAKEIRELVEGLERDSRTAAMAADVPTIDFPDEDGKYFSSGKYGYA